MRLNGDFELIKKDEYENEVVAHGEAGERLSGMLKSSESVNYIFQFLMEETTEGEVVKKMVETFEAPEDDIKTDVSMIVNGLRNLGYLVE